MFTEEDSKRQDEAFAALKDEFSRIEQIDKALCKAFGLPEEGPLKLNVTDKTPEVLKAFEEAKAKAESEGAARAAQFKNGARSGASANTAAGRGRRGVVRL